MVQVCDHASEHPLGNLPRIVSGLERRRELAATPTWATLLISVLAAAQEAHGVIAFGTETDQSNGVAYGFAWNFPARETALAEAVNACITSGGANCMQLTWFQDGCGALAMDQHGNAQGRPGMTLEQAEARAFRACEAADGAECDIVGSLCAAQGGEPRTWSGSESVLSLPDAETTAVSAGARAAVSGRTSEELGGVAASGQGNRRSDRSGPWGR